MNHPMFSVIVPAYNVAVYLKTSLASILEQSFHHWECICINDGSSDDTGDVLDSWQKRDIRFRVFHTTNQGVSSARNFAIDIAKGEYLVFLDADDAYRPYALEYLSNVINKFGGPDIISYGATTITSKLLRADEGDDFSQATESAYFLDKTSDLNNALRNRLGGMIAWNACYRRETVSNVKFENMPNGEDILWGMHCMMVSHRMVCSSCKIYKHLVRSGSAATTFSEKHARSAILCFRRMAESASVWERKNEVCTVLFGRTLSLALGYVKNILRQLSFKKRHSIYPEYISALKFLCRDADLLSGWRRVYYSIAVSCSLSRLCMLEIPFQCYSFICKHS